MHLHFSLQRVTLVIDCTHMKTSGSMHCGNLAASVLGQGFGKIMSGSELKQASVMTEQLANRNVCTSPAMTGHLPYSDTFRYTLKSYTVVPAV